MTNTPAPESIERVARAIALESYKLVKDNAPEFALERDRYVASILEDIKPQAVAAIAAMNPCQPLPTPPESEE